MIENKTLDTWKKYCSRYNKALRAIKTDLRIYRIDRANLWHNPLWMREKWVNFQLHIKCLNRSVKGNEEILINTNQQSAQDYKYSWWKLPGV